MLRDFLDDIYITYVNDILIYTSSSKADYNT